MKVLNFLFRDFWRKLVALIFAVVIYWQVGESIKQSEMRREAQSTVRLSRVDTVHIVDLGVDRHVFFAEGSKPAVKVSLKGGKRELAGLKDGDVLFCVVADKTLKPGEHTLPVRCYSRRSGVTAHSIKPAKIKVTIVENPFGNHNK